MAEPARTSSRRFLFAAACAGMFVFGIVLATLGALFGLPQMRARIHADLAQQGEIFFVLYLGVFVATLIVGPIIDSFGNKVVLTLSAILVTAGLVGFSAVHSFGGAVVAAFVLGFGGAGLNTSPNVLVADLYDEGRGTMLNLLGMFFGVGAVFIPLLAATIIGVLTIPQLLLIAAALAALCAIAYSTLTFPMPREPSGFSVLASIRATRIPGVMLFAFLLLLESGNEAAIGGWASTYAGSAGLAPETATWILAGYWGSLMAGRLLGARILKGLRKESLVLASGIGSTLGTVIFLLIPSLLTLAAGVVIIGLSFAAIYPTTLAIAADRYPRHAGTVFGLLFAVGLIGGMLFPWLIGLIAEHSGVRAGMILPLAGALMITALSVIIARGRSSRPQHDAAAGR